LKNIFSLIKDLTEGSSEVIENSEPTMSEEATERLSTQLSLTAHDEHWGLANSDADRLEEFLAFYESHVPIEPMESEELADLILQSAEDAFDDENPSNRDRMVLVALFVQAHHLEFPMVIEFYAGLDSSDGDIATVIENALLDHYGQRPL
jgi:hypothetical protein